MIEQLTTLYVRENYDTMPKHVIEYYGIEKDKN